MARLPCFGRNESPCQADFDSIDSNILMLRRERATASQFLVQQIFKYLCVRTYASLWEMKGLLRELLLTMPDEILDQGLGHPVPSTA